MMNKKMTTWGVGSGLLAWLIWMLVLGNIFQQQELNGGFALAELSFALVGLILALAFIGGTLVGLGSALIEEVEKDG